MTATQLDEWMTTALSLVRKGGDVVRESIYKKKNIEMKCSDADLVTETDKAVEEMLIGELRKKYPDHKFIAEESFGGKCEFTDSPTWIIDPVDGTMNFVHTFPYVAISVALSVNKQIELGIVFCPVLDQMFTAKRGKGSFMNGNKIEVSHQDDLKKSLVFSEMGGDRSPEKVKVILSNITSLIGKVHNFRALGSAALNMCYVAAGWGDAYYEFGIHCWDIAAGALIVEEAGGIVIDTEGGPVDLMSRRMICASTAAVAQSLSKELVHLKLERDC